ncbi:MULTISPECIES: glycine cleavage system protein GcvH [unclassified Salinibacterium]|uniref:glycine cleavage system protein GcvH n=1 Tax=unclassified Salinibacterium TaxID=2632331 RepID=UPI00142023C5|nr:MULTISPECIES: glycine cleavage system protein GcvH [unclassified Salinibacterium]
MTDLTALKYTDQHEWLLVEGDVVTVGITDYAAGQLGDVVFVELPEVGATVQAGTVVCEVESTKSVGEVYAPANGEVVERNDAVIDTPELLNGDAFSAWLFKLRVDDPSVFENGGFLTRDQYTALEA